MITNEERAYIINNLYGKIDLMCNGICDLITLDPKDNDEYDIIRDAFPNALAVNYMKMRNKFVKLGDYYNTKRKGFKQLILYKYKWQTYVIGKLIKSNIDDLTLDIIIKSMSGFSGDRIKDYMERMYKKWHI